MIKRCKKCSRDFNTSYNINGVQGNAHTRSYCFDCSPYKSGNRYRLDTHDAEEKTCKTCRKKLNRKMFYKSSSKTKQNGDISNHQQSSCIECTKQIINDRDKNLKQYLVDYKGGKCNLCGYNKTICVLEFHHTDPNQKDFEISRRRGCSIDKTIKELDKCLLLCCNCHQEIHRNKLIYGIHYNDCTFLN
jgi:hypothetical protein